MDALYRWMCIVLLVVCVAGFTGGGLYALWLTVAGVADQNGYWMALGEFALAAASFVIFRAALRFADRKKK
jgi:membrane protein implicated in regulation of membrane protease activity